MRPALYVGQHPIVILNDRPLQTRQYVVIGHDDGSSDLLTPSPGDSELRMPGVLHETALGDLAVIEGVSACCTAMRTIGCTSPTPNEVIILSNGSPKLVRQRGEIKDAS